MRPCLEKGKEGGGKGRAKPKGTSEVAQQVSGIAAKPDNLNSIPGTHMGEIREPTPGNCPLTSINASWNSLSQTVSLSF